MMCEKAKISSNPANWDNHLFDPLGLVKSPATKSVSLQKQTFSYGKMNQNYKITEQCFHFFIDLILRKEHVKLTKADFLLD